MSDPRPAIHDPQSIELHIEELVLHGFTPSDRHGIGEAVERELARLFTGQDVPPSLMRGGGVAHLDGGTFEAPRGAGAGTIGTQVAQAVYGGLSR